MKNKHIELLRQVFDQPVRAGIVWKEAEMMLKALGADLSEGNGSRVRVVLNGVRAVFHRPHPRKEMDKGSVVSLRRFLIEAGISNDDI